MAEYTPTTKNIEDCYLYLAETLSWQALAEFNRWLDSVKHEAWDQGATAATYSISATHHYANNPYKDSL
jgi:hypothetical protein